MIKEKTIANMVSDIAEDGGVKITRIPIEFQKNPTTLKKFLENAGLQKLTILMIVKHLTKVGLVRGEN